MPAADPRREARLKAALRANLRRRKQAGGDGHGEPGERPADDDAPPAPPAPPRGD